MSLWLGVKLSLGDFHGKPQIVADSPLLLEIKALEGAGTAENHRKPQIGLCHLRSVTSSSARKIHSGNCFVAQRTEIAAIFAICDCAHRRPQKSPAISETLHCDLRVRWRVAGDLRFRVAISEVEIPSFCGISGAIWLR